MLNNIGLPGIIFLIAICIAMYLLLRSRPEGRMAGEASRLKYILVWVLAGFLVNVFMNIFTTIWGNSFTASIVDPPAQLGMFIAFYTIAFIGAYLIFVGTYSLFQNLDRRKVILWVWIASILGALVQVGQIVELEVGALFPNYESYNIAAVIIRQVAFLILVVRWIRHNPGFVEPEYAPSSTSKERMTPRLSVRDPVSKGVGGFEANKLAYTELEEEENEISEAPQADKSRREDAGNIRDVGNIAPKLNKSEETREQIDPSELRKHEGENLVDDSEYKSEVTTTLDLDKDSQDELKIDPIIIKDEVYAAAKFEDKRELLKLLKTAGFTMQNSDAGITMLSPSGEAELLRTDTDLFAYGKRFARK